MNVRSAPTVTVLTHLTSPYQVELFDAVAASGRCILTVVYMTTSSSIRSWGERAIAHDHIVMGKASDADIAERLVSADLSVFNYYNDRRVLPMLKQRAVSGKPWAFWGERPGVRLPDWLGRPYRRWTLRELLRSDAPVWGIGRFAMERYREEFGGPRPCENFPYFSDLSRFRIERKAARVRQGHTTFLFSGALIPRKGIDLLAQAFVRLATKRSDVRLRIMGKGELESSLRTELLSVSDRVEFVGFRDWDDLPAEYHAADVLCVPSRHDGWALVVPEGLASGLPVIGTDRTGAALEFIQPRSNGWLIPVGSAEALERAMHDAANLTDADLATCSAIAMDSVARHDLQDGADRFAAAAMAAIEGWGRSRESETNVVFAANT